MHTAPVLKHPVSFRGKRKGSYYTNVKRGKHPSCPPVPPFLVPPAQAGVRSLTATYGIPALSVKTAGCLQDQQWKIESLVWGKVRDGDSALKSRELWPHFLGKGRALVSLEAPNCQLGFRSTGGTGNQGVPPSSQSPIFLNPSLGDKTLGSCPKPGTLLQLK